jgi:hypothetical protein
MLVLGLTCIEVASNLQPEGIFGESDEDVTSVMSLGKSPNPWGQCCADGLSSAGVGPGGGGGSIGNAAEG